MLVCCHEAHLGVLVKSVKEARAPRPAEARHDTKTRLQDMLSPSTASRPPSYVGTVLVHYGVAAEAQTNQPLREKAQAQTIILVWSLVDSSPAKHAFPNKTTWLELGHPSHLDVRTPPIKSQSSLPVPSPPPASSLPIHAPCVKAPSPWYPIREGFWKICKGQPQQTSGVCPAVHCALRSSYLSEVEWPVNVTV